MLPRQAIRVAYNEDTKQVETSRCAFLWEDVYMLEDDSDRGFAYEGPLTWVRTMNANFYIEGEYEAVCKEWDAYSLTTDTMLVFSRN
jgi:hypothetical protein